MVTYWEANDMLSSNYYCYCRLVVLCQHSWMHCFKLFTLYVFSPIPQVALIMGHNQCFQYVVTNGCMNLFKVEVLVMWRILILGILSHNKPWLAAGNCRGEGRWGLEVEGWLTRLHTDGYNAAQHTWDETHTRSLSLNASLVVCGVSLRCFLSELCYVFSIVQEWPPYVQVPTSWADLGFIELSA